MSKLDELIVKICPDGVEYRELKDVLTKSHSKICLFLFTDRTFGTI